MIWYINWHIVEGMISAAMLLNPSTRPLGVASPFMFIAYQNLEPDPPEVKARDMIEFFIGFFGFLILAVPLIIVKLLLA